MLTGQALQRPGYVARGACHCHNMKPFKAFQKSWHSRMACSQQSPETDICKPNMQDVFEAGFIPSDTDYRMFSAATGQLGQWPGLDIAHILDSASYHTKQDNLQRLRPGILQVS